VRVVYDSIGRETWQSSLNCLQRRGFMVSYGYASGAVPPFTLDALAERSIFLTRPHLKDYLSTPKELSSSSASLFSVISDGSVTVDIAHTLPLTEVARAHKFIEARDTIGSVILIP
jgi:NADPH:quinone reductase